MSEETSCLYRKHRPKQPDDLVGQPALVEMLTGYAADPKTVPQAILLSGPSGCGKTTIARMIRRIIGCNRVNYNEINCPALEKIVQEIRTVEDASKVRPLGGGCKVYYFDEAHVLPKSPAQQAVLKMLEDPEPWAYYILATTEPEKLIRTIMTRVTHLAVSLVGEADLTALVKRVSKAEGFKASPAVVERIVECAEGSPRMALTMLDQVRRVAREEDQLNMVLRADTKRNAYELVKMLVFNPKAKWSEVAAILKQMDDSPEGFRQQVLGFASKILLDDGRSGARAAFILEAFNEPVHYNGKPGIVRACYEVFNNKD